PSDQVRQGNLPEAMKVQILLFAKALDHAFAEQVFVGTVQREINRIEGRSEPQLQEAETNPFDKLWAAAGVSEDGFVPAVDAADMKSIWGRVGERLAAAEVAGGNAGEWWVMWCYDRA